MKIIIVILILIGAFQLMFAQKAQEKSLGIINGMAINLPKPEYSDEAKKFCAGGKVEVEITINATGDVIEAKAVSGDELLWSSAVDAVKKAKFRSLEHSSAAKLKGIIVYNFVSERKCITGGIVNNKARILPKPIFPRACRCVGLIKVRVVIDMNGDVIHASTVSGNPLLRISAIEAARKAKFYPTLIDTSKPIYVVAFLEYDFESNGKVST